MKKSLLAVITATVLAVNAVPLSAGAFSAVPAENYQALAEETKFEAENFFVAVGTYSGATQLRYFAHKADGGYTVDKVVWEDAPADISYGDVFIADGEVSMTKVMAAPNDPVYAMAYYYQLDESAKLDKAGNCENFMEQRELTVTSKTYDGSAHWSIRYKDSEGKEYYYGLSTFASTLTVNPLDCEVGDVYTYALYNDYMIVPLAKKDAESDVNKEPEYRIVSLPDKVEYKVGEQIDLKGIEIEVTMDKKEPVVYTYPDVAFDYQSNIPRAPRVVLSSDFRSDKTGTYKVEIVGADNVSFEVRVVDNDTPTTTTTANNTTTTTTKISTGTTVTSTYATDAKGRILDSEGNVLIVDGTSAVMSQPANTTTTTRAIIDYAVKVEYDKSPMKTGEKREVKFYNPETKTAKNGKVNTSSDCISIDYEEGKDTFTVTALKEGKAEIYVTAAGCAFGAYVYIEVSSAEQTETETSYKLKVTVLDAYDDYIFVRPDMNSQVYNFSNKFAVPTNSVDIGAAPAAGMVLEVTYPKNYFLTTYPARFSDIKNVALISSKPDIFKGDTNCDCQMDMSDAVLIMQALANPDKYGENGKDPYHHLTALGRLNGDNDGDGLTVGDALAIQRKLLGLSEDEQSAKALIGKTYVYEKSGSFTITFDEHGRFACHEKDILSYMTEGTWELNGDTVKLAYPVDESTEKAVYLKLKDSDLVYIGEKSDNFTSVKVQDGEKFIDTKIRNKVDWYDDYMISLKKDTDWSKNNKNLSAVIKDTDGLKSYLEQFCNEKAMSFYLDKYDDSFFKDNVLFMKWIFQGSGSAGPAYMVNVTMQPDNGLCMFVMYNGLLNGDSMASVCLAQVTVPKGIYDDNKEYNWNWVGYNVML